MEMLGTLIGAALQGQIVASAHVSPHCTVNPSVNTTDSWHDTATIPDPADPLSPQVSVYGNTLKYPVEEGGAVFLTPFIISSWMSVNMTSLESVMLELRQ